VGVRGEREGERKIIFWNVAGLSKKDEEFWEYIREYDLIGLVETWLDGKGWERIKGWLPDSHDWEVKEARKDKRKGRAKGGMLLGRRKGWGEKEEKVEGEEKEDMGKMVIREGRDKWVVITIYNGGEWRDLERKLQEEIEEIEGKEESTIIIGGDFNIRTGELGCNPEGKEDRKSRDKTIGNGGRNLMWWMQEKGWYVMNGTTKGDWRGEFTYVGARGSSVIDYIFVNETAHDRVLSFKIDDRVDSDHMPLCLKIKKREEEEREEAGEEEERTRTKEKIIWNEEAKKKYQEITEKMVMEDGGWTVEERWKGIKDIVEKAMVRKTIKIRRRKIGYKDWWDRECTKRKRKLERDHTRWRRGKVSRERFMEEKRAYTSFLGEKQRKWRNEEERILRRIKKETDVWKFINRKKGKGRHMENEIKADRWRAHFKDLLEGMDEVGGKKRREEKGEELEEEEENIGEEEIREVVKRMKKRKAAGVDGIPMEAWKYAGKGLWKGLVDLIKQVWKEGAIPEDWRKGIIVPLHKKGDPDVTSNYRGISLLCTAYKIYVELLRRRLEEEVERKAGLPETQMGFRRGRSTMDGIFILNHLVQREWIEGEKEKKIYAFFADLRAAFDNVDRELLWDIFRKMGIREGLIRRLEKIYERTEVMVRTDEGMTEKFETSKGVRQGCVLSPLLFNMYIAGVDEEFRKRGIGGIELGCDRIWNLAYADDLVLIARNREALEDMMGTLRKFLKERKLELSAEKSKVLVFNKGRKEKKEEWRWKGREIEEVQCFKYLGVTLDKKGEFREHIKELERKGKRVMRKVWGLGERICREDLIRRWMLFKYLVQSVISYGVELWGWEEREELEKIMMDYIRWIFRLDFCTPRYIMKREIGIEKLKVGWGMRAMRFEDRVRNSGNKLIRECWEEKRERGWKDTYGKEREKFYSKYGWEREGERITKRELEQREGQMREWEKKREREEGFNRILEARYNERYKEILAVGEVPRYIEKRNVEGEEVGDKVRALMKLRCGNLEEWNKFWIEEERRNCKFCKKGRDNIEHYIEECTNVKEWFSGLGNDKKEIWDRLWSEDLDEEKGKVIIRLWKTKEKLMRVEGESSVRS